MCYAVDTNVPVVANAHGPGGPSLECRKQAVLFLLELVRVGRLVLDVDGEVMAEYRTHLSPRGEPGVGDRFYLEALNSHPDRVVRVALPRRADGEYAHLPTAVRESTFDPDDRKFAALAIAAQAPVSNATDTDWVEHRDLLNRNGIDIEFVCGCDPARWFVVAAGA